VFHPRLLAGENALQSFCTCFRDINFTREIFEDREERIFAGMYIDSSKIIYDRI